MLVSSSELTLTAALAVSSSSREVIQPSTPYIALLASNNLDLEIHVVWP